MYRAIIVGGDYHTSYVIKTFMNNHIPFIVVNSDPTIAKFLSLDNQIDVVCNETNKLFTYRDLHIDNYDLVVALEKDDVKNYIIIRLLKENFNVKKAICTVNDPNNVEIFKVLGVDTPICSSFLLSQSIINDSGINEITKNQFFEDDKICVFEIVLKSRYKICNKEIKDISFPISGSIASIYRAPNVIIPRGNTKLLPGDCLIVSCRTASRQELIDFIRNE